MTGFDYIMATIIFMLASVAAATVAYAGLVVFRFLRRVSLRLVMVIKNA